MKHTIINCFYEHDIYRSIYTRTVPNIKLNIHFTFNKVSTVCSQAVIYIFETNNILYSSTITEEKFCTDELYGTFFE